MMWGWHEGWGWGGWLVMTLGGLVFWGLVVWGLVAVVRGGSERRAPESRPEEILARRFAAGEIDQGEYRTRLETVRSEDRSWAAGGRPR